MEEREEDTAGGSLRFINQEILNNIGRGGSRLEHFLTWAAKDLDFFRAKEQKWSQKVKGGGRVYAVRVNKPNYALDGSKYL